MNPAIEIPLLDVKAKTEKPPPRHFLFAKPYNEYQNTNAFYEQLSLLVGSLQVTNCENYIDFVHFMKETLFYHLSRILHTLSGFTACSFKWVKVLINHIWFSPWGQSLGQVVQNIR